MFLLYTDFGVHGPYVGQLHTVLAQQAPGHPVIDLMHDAPRFNPPAAGCLLAALAGHFPPATICVAVIDPGVGSTRRPVAVQAGQHWFVGPDNGLFNRLGAVFEQLHWHEITWRPALLSASFHGRDLFAPMAAALAKNTAHDRLQPLPAPAPVTELAEVIYIDGFGNAMTGLPADSLPAGAILMAHGQAYAAAETFSAVPVGSPFWYRNSLGLAELAVNQGSAADSCGLQIGDPITISA